MGTRVCSGHSMVAKSRSGALSRNAIVRSFRPLANLSYSLYAMHTPAIMLATWALLHAGLRSYALQLSATMIASVAATLVVHFGIERVFYRPRADVPSIERPLNDSQHRYESLRR